MRTLILFFSLLITLLTSCVSMEDRRENEISNIPIRFSSVRFDSIFFNTPSQELHVLKKDFPFLFPSQTPDSVWINKQKDTLELDIFHQVNAVFPNLKKENISLKKLFQHIKHEFAEFKIPKVIFLTSDVDYKNRVIYSDSLLLISLDCYLGKNHYFYQDIPSYIRQDFSPDYITIDVAYQIASSFIENKQVFHQNFLQSIIYEGKRQYLMSLFLGKTPMYMQFQYTNNQFLWAEHNESDIWRYFIENEMLYSTDKKLLNRFIYTAPFSKFYLDIDSESPGRIGVFIGYKIVSSYMKNHPNSSLKDMLYLPYDELFLKSQYKPKL